MDDATYAMMKRAVLDLIGLDLDQYKPQQMRRRLGNFVQTQADGDAELFLTKVRADPALLDGLRNMITINVSEFFRDSPQFTTLEEQVLPSLVATGKHLKIWSAACSAGQEPYSIAMLLDEMGASSRTRITATDFDETILHRARAGGPYVDDDLRQMSEARRARYIQQRDGDRFGVVPELRRMVSFSRHNLLEDDYGQGYNLIICRNVIIYFSAEAKRAVVERFRQALAPDGVLFLGGTEALLGKDAAGFQQLGGNLYRRLPDAEARAA